MSNLVYGILDFGTGWRGLPFDFGEEIFDPESEDQRQKLIGFFAHMRHALITEKDELTSIYEDCRQGIHVIGLKSEYERLPLVIANPLDLDHYCDVVIDMDSNVMFFRSNQVLSLMSYLLRVEEDDMARMHDDPFIFKEYHVFNEQTKRVEPIASTVYDRSERFPYMVTTKHIGEESHTRIGCLVPTSRALAAFHENEE